MNARNVLVRFYRRKTRACLDPVRVRVIGLGLGLVLGAGSFVSKTLVCMESESQEIGTKTWHVHGKLRQPRRQVYS